jgi:hypothetical protein
MANTTINQGQTVTTTVLLDEFSESLAVRSGGRLQTGALPAGVLTQNNLNRVKIDQNGLIQSEQTAIQIEGIGSIIQNRGTVSGDLNGINIANGNTASARIKNWGLITSSEGGRAVNIGAVGGALINRGLITGTGDPRNGTVYGDVTAQNVVINNRTNGVIDVGAGLNGDAISLELGAQVKGGITNRGLIQGRGVPDGLANNVTNQSAALRLYWAETAGAPWSNFNGDITNFGTLAAESGAAVILENQTQLNGNIFNHGLIESVDPETGIGISFQGGSQFKGEIVNSGIINGGRDGVSFGNGGQVEGTLRNLVGGVISSTSRGVNLGGNGNQVVNAGQIITTADPRNGTVYADETANNFTIKNARTGVIDVGVGNNGDAVSLELGAAVTGALINRGLIQGRGLPDGLPNNVTNQAAAVRLYRGATVGDRSIFQGDIQNLGTGVLASDKDDAILIEAQVQFDGDIVNQGKLVAGGDGIDIDGKVMGKILNQGLIAGTQTAIDATTAQAGVTVKNTGVIKGDVVLSELGDRFDSAQGKLKGTMAGLGGDDDLIGSRLNDVITGGMGDDTLTGGLGRDRFVFTPKDLGADWITDFQGGQDSLDVSAFNFGATDVQTVINTAQQLGADTLLTLAPQNTVLLAGVQASTLNSTDFTA